MAVTDRTPLLGTRGRRVFAAVAAGFVVGAALWALSGVVAPWMAGPAVDPLTPAERSVASHTTGTLLVALTALFALLTGVSYAAYRVVSALSSREHRSDT